LLLFLHGAGERGNDNEKQLIHGSKLFITEENRKNFPAIIIFPQCPQESFWAVMKTDQSKQPPARVFDYTVEPNWPLVAAND
jgi:predicted peptidase